MAVIERDVVLISVLEDGSQAIDMPLTRLGMVEDTAEEKTAPIDTDYVPVIDSEDSMQMKKAPLTAIRSKSALGLEKVDNTSDMEKPISNAARAALDLKADGEALESHILNETTHVTQAEREAWNNKADGTELSVFSAHTGNTNNPHAVTKAQVGLGNADNTSDANKPVSAATQAALDGKADASHTHSASDIADGTLSADRLPVVPLSKGGSGQTTAPLSLYSFINNSTELDISGIAMGDYIAVGDVSAATGKKIKLSSLKYAMGDINGCRYVVGTSASGWTAKDCDYLCDGTADQIEINAAITSLPSTGGEVVILDGTYNLKGPILVNKDCVTLTGSGRSTILKRGFEGSGSEPGLIYVTSSNNTIRGLSLNGMNVAYIGSYNSGVYLSGSGNTITGNTCSGNNSNGVYLKNGSKNTITGNTCSDSNSNGVYVDGGNFNTITGNTCSGNFNGVALSSSSNCNTVTGNTCSSNNSNGIYVHDGSGNTITGNTCSGNNDSGVYVGRQNNTVTGNTCSGNNSNGIYVHGDYNTITGNDCNYNTNGIDLDSCANSTITGNTCSGNTGKSIYLSGTSNNYNLIAGNNIYGMNYVSEGGTSNTFVNNKYS